MTPRAHVPVEALRYAWERSDWHHDVPFGRALADPVLGPLLRLGALIITRREPIDRKRLAAGESPKDFD